MLQRKRIDKINFAFISVFALFAFCSCAPKVTSKYFPEPVTNFGPRNHDSDLKLDKLHTNAIDLKTLGLDEDIKTNDFFNAAENILLLSKRNHPEIEKLGHIMIEGFYNSNFTTSRSNFSKGPYLQAAIGETQADAKDAIFDVVKMLNLQMALVTNVIDNSKKTYDWPKTELKLDQIVDFVEGYIQSLEKKWSKARLDPRVYSAIKDGINEQLQPATKQIRPILSSMMTEINLTTFINDIYKVVGILNVDLDADAKTQLQQGMDLGKFVDAAQDEADGLKVLIFIWRMLDPQDRKTQFEPISSALYKFLNGANDSQLDCLAGKPCHLNIITIIAKKTEILPQIKAYGIDKLKAQVNAGAVQVARDAVSLKITPILKDELPATLDQKVKDGFAAESKVLAKISKDFKGFLTPGVNTWAKNYVDEGAIGINALELTDIHLKFSSSSQLSFAKVHGQTTGAATLGSSMSALETRWELLQESFSNIPFGTETALVNKLMGSKNSAEHTHIKELLSQINKALAIGGFRVSDTEKFKSLTYALDPDGTINSTLDLQHFIENPISFIVPNVLVVTDAFHGAPPFTKELSADVEDQAQLLKGLSRMVYFFHDWEQNSFDRLLGNIKVNDFVEDPQMKSIDQKFFPKEILFTLFTGNAAVILGNFSKNLSTILLLDEHRNLSWENDMAANSTAPISAMAALVNIEKSRRGEVASASALAHELDALIEFYNATDGVEKTNATFLLQKGADGKNTIDALLDGRHRVFLLIAAVANFLTHEMQSPDGGIYHGYDLTNKVPIKSPRLLKDQVCVIEALVRAGKLVSAQTYQNSALDIYYFVNSKLWNQSKAFYVLAEGQTSIGTLPDIVEALYSIDILSDIMSNNSLTQWKKISAPWLTALKQF